MTRVTELETFHVDSIPRLKQYGVLYVSKRFGIAIHLCACGWCGWETVTPFFEKEEKEENKETDHQWSYSETDKRVTLHPSIGNMQFPCKSHYWVQDGKINWC